MPSDTSLSRLPDPPAPAIAHGGNRASAELRFGIAAANWLDLSTGINPTPYPVPPLDPGLWAELPQPNGERALEAAARATYRLPDAAAVQAAPGTQSLIQWLPRLFPARRVGILGPTYAEHAGRWRAAGAEVFETGDPGALARADTAVVVNPNNPDGRRLEPQALLALVDRLLARGGRLIVDEAFADVAPEISVASATGRPGLLVLRSFGKFFGLAGLRLGFALGPPRDMAMLRDAFGPWAVSGPALEIGRRALADEAWITATRDRLRRDAARLDALLARAGLAVGGGTDLFRLALLEHAERLHEHLGRFGILTRRFDDHPRRLRLGLPGSEAGFVRLAAALASFHP